MGREVRRVPPNWKHPEETKPYIKFPHYKPMYDENIDDAFKKWFEGLNLWLEKKGDYIGNEGSGEGYVGYVDWAGTSPDPEYYRDYKDEEATWYQLYETVSEGTPVSPPFETKKDLINYLVEHGDFHDQEIGLGGMDYECAKNLVERGFAMSFVITNGILKEGKNFLKTQS